MPDAAPPDPGFVSSAAATPKLAAAMPPSGRPAPTMKALSPAERRRLAATPGLALLLAVVAAATIATVWTLQRAGYVPCELCLAERNPFYAGAPLALFTAWAAWRQQWRLAAAGFVILALLFLGSAIFAAYHAGVEWQLWAGPTGCSGPLTSPTSVTDFMAQLKSVTVVRCDAPALMVFGLSLAGWNVLVSLMLSALAIVGARATWRAARP